MTKNIKIFPGKKEIHITEGTGIIEVPEGWSLVSDIKFFGVKESNKRMRIIKDRDLSYNKYKNLVNPPPLVKPIIKEHYIKNNLSESSKTTIKNAKFKNFTQNTRASGGSHFFCEKNKLELFYPIGNQSIRVSFIGSGDWLASAKFENKTSEHDAFEKLKELIKNK